MCKPREIDNDRTIITKVIQEYKFVKCGKLGTYQMDCIWLNSNECIMKGSFQSVSLEPVTLFVARLGSHFFFFLVELKAELTDRQASLVLMSCV